MKSTQDILILFGLLSINRKTIMYAHLLSAKMPKSYLFNHFNLNFVFSVKLHLLHYFIFNFFLVGWSSQTNQNYGELPSVKSNITNLIRSIRTVMRSKYKYDVALLPRNSASVSFII